MTTQVELYLLCLASLSTDRLQEFLSETTGRHGLAISDAQRTMELNPKLLEPYVTLARIYTIQKKWDLVIRYTTGGFKVTRRWHTGTSHTRPGL